MRLVLLPGMDGTGKLYKPLITALPGDINFEVISCPTQGILSYKELEDYVRKHIPENEEFIFIAESFSGVIAYNIAKHTLNNLKSIIFVASFLERPQQHLNLLNWLPLSLIFKLPVPDLFLKNYFLGKNINKETVNLFKNAIQSVSGRVLAHRYREISNLSNSLETLHIPCAYIKAENDKLVPASNLDAFKTINTNIKVYSIDGPHFILQSKPEKCAEVIVEEYRKISTI